MDNSKKIHDAWVACKRPTSLFTDLGPMPKILVVCARRTR